MKEEEMSLIFPLFIFSTLIHIILAAASHAVWLKNRSNQFCLDFTRYMVWSSIIGIGYTVLFGLSHNFLPLAYGIFMIGFLFSSTELTAMVLHLSHGSFSRAQRIGAYLFFALLFLICVGTSQAVILNLSVTLIALLAAGWLWRLGGLYKIIGPLIFLSVFSSMLYVLFHTDLGLAIQLLFSVTIRFVLCIFVVFLALERTERERDQAVEKLHQSQKMEAVGQLAGGVAHDFNNTLGAIVGAAELLKSETISVEEQREYIDMILTAGERAADLTKKLLTFSRKGTKSSSAVDGFKIVSDTAALLKHTLNKNISVEVENRAVQSSVIGDDSQLQNAFMNMGINAAHAMPNGGTLLFTLENLELDEEYCAVSSFDIKPGEYLEISVRDTGTGMTPEIQARIFEPFFTTKEPGQGTGLGMAAVYGTVREHGGAITVYSEPGAGTVFHIYLPVTAETVRREIETIPVSVGTGTVLVIDDEELIRITAAAMLRSLGYRVILAANGLEGVETFREAQEEIDLIILDMIMPVMGGREAFEKIREIDPSIPVVIASGFSKEEDTAAMKKLGISGFLNKPFRKAELAEITSRAIKA